MSMIVCEKCGVDFKADKPVRRFCSKSCAATLQADSTRKWSTKEERRELKNAGFRLRYHSNVDESRRRKREAMKRLRRESPERYRSHSRRAKEKQRALLLAIYGALCVRCGFTDVRALTLDHVLNNGASERREVGDRGVYQRALKEAHRSEYQTLCMNCQFIKRAEAVLEWQQSHGAFLKRG